MMRGIGSSLMVKVAATLVAVGLMPLVITFFQLSSNADALFEQLHRTHMVALASAAGQIDAYLGALDGLGAELAGQAALADDVRGSAFQALLASTLRTRPEIAFIGLYDASGATVVEARRRDLRDELTPLALGGGAAPDDTAPGADVATGLEWRRGVAREWIVWRRPLGAGVGLLVLAADAGAVAAMVAPEELGDQAEIALFDGALEPLSTGADRPLDLPADVVATVRSSRLTSGSSRVRAQAGDDALLVGYKRLTQAPWTLVSRQPSAAAAIARERMRRATALAVLGALGLASLLSVVAYRTVVLPIRRITRQQRQLSGGAIAADGGNEIAALEDAFKLLERRLRDSEGLGKVFLGRYQVVALIGGGGMGRVFRGWDTKLQRPVALKTIRLEKAEDSARLVQSLLKEAEMVASFRHPNIVTIHDVTEDDSAAFLAMELVEGISLERLLAQRRRLGFDDVACLGVAVTSGLMVAHEHGLVHHDVKPANILLGHDGSIKVADFGIAQFITTAVANESGAICGTPGYLPPETFEGKGYGPAGDLFGLGVVLYQSLSGGRPFEGTSTHDVLVKTMADSPIPIDEWVPDLPKTLDDLVMGLLDKDPAKRPAAQVVRARLEQFLLDRRVVPRGIPVPEGLAQGAKDSERGTQYLPSQLIELPTRSTGS